MSKPDYILHYAPDNASLVVRLALEELKLEYETSLVDRQRKGQKNPAYLALNPNGLIPVLETPEGPLFETAAILLWLADRHGGLAPIPTSPDRGDCLKWLFFLSNTLHPALRRLFYPELYVGADSGIQSHLNAASRRAIKDHLAVLNTRFESDRCGLILDIYLGPMVRWLALYPAQSDTSWFDLRSYPALFRAARALEDRPSLQSAFRAEGLGENPFTKPQPATPPEGSPT
ncbi:MAG: glutathione S-transferase family protein [Pseudomonadota bacterium]